MALLVISLAKRLAPVVAWLVVGCALEAPPNLEDAARTVAPVPACLIPLPARAAATIGSPRSLPTAGYWQVVFRDVGASASRVSPNAVACNGDHVLGDPILAQGRFEGRIAEGQLVVGKGPDHLTVVWLKTHTFEGGRVGGALALVRAMETHAELYGLAPYVASLPTPTLSVERTGGTIVVTSEEAGCAPGHPGGTKSSCLSRTKVFTLLRGRLHLALEIPSERIEQREGAEAGTRGKVEYHLTSQSQFQPGGVRVLERLVVREIDTDRNVRVVERDRLLSLNEAAGRSTNTASLWDTAFDRH